MAIGDKNDLCAVCGKKTNAFTRVKLTDGFLCSTCKTWCSDFVQIRSMSSADARAHIAKTLQDDAVYPTLVPSESVGKHLVVYSKERLWSCMVTKGETPYLFSFDDIVNYELIEDGASVTKGGLGSAAVGGLLFGSVGAIVGGGLGKKQHDLIQKMSIRISTRVPLMSYIEIPILTAETKRNGMLYRSCKETAMRILSLLDQITAQQEHHDSVSVSSSADEILKFKKLLDDGIITQEEFDAKKRQLLGL